MSTSNMEIVPRIKFLSVYKEQVELATDDPS